ncbi:MAG: Ppx/GppA family phosphatase [Geminicoccaceae bacterium]|nr:Ppx/GppA family phosphatase [Geminicoccaceae bacterium]
MPVSRAIGLFRPLSAWIEPVKNRPCPTGEPRFAALDLGTNNCRLLVAEPRSDGFAVVDSFSRITRLGEGLAASGCLAETAMARTIAALKICRRIMQRNDVIMARCVATEACRRAANGPEFIERVQRVTGVSLEILDHEEEARLALLGCLPLIDDDADQLLMIDIGGGSTEVMWLDRQHPVRNESIGRSISLPIGVVTLSESFGDNHGEARVYDRMVGHVREMLAVAGSGRSSPPRLNGSRVQMLGTSGTVTTLAALHLGLERYDRSKVDGMRLPFSAIFEVTMGLRELDDAHRAAHPCIGAGRADLVVAGCAILDAIHACWPVGSLRVADRGVREGILNALMGRSLHQALAGVTGDFD